MRRQEEQARRRAAYHAALVYPPLDEKLADFVARIARNDAEIERVNRRRPDGAAWIAGAEMIARQVQSFNDVAAAVPPRITEHLRLPAFRYSGLDAYTWPRPRGRASSLSRPFGDVHAMSAIPSRADSPHLVTVRLTCAIT